MSDSAPITFFLKQVSFEYPKTDKIGEQYEYSGLLPEYLSQTFNPNHFEENKSRKEACKAILLWFQRSEAASAGTAQVLPKGIPENKYIFCLLCQDTPCYWVQLERQFFLLYVLITLSSL